MARVGSAEPEAVSGVRKAAILMVMIGHEASSAILREMDEDEVQEISREIAAPASTNVPGMFTP